MSQQSMIPGLVPVLTSELRSSEARRASGRRGVGSVGPISSAVVIGLGGTGIQITSRLQGAIDADRPEQHGIDSIRIIGIDAVSEEKQSEKLPPGAQLRLGSMVVVNDFNAKSILNFQRGQDPALDDWWDDDYKVPAGNLVDGLRRERMLGRLCFYSNRGMIRDRIREQMVLARDLRGEHVGAGEVHDGEEIDVYLVCSAAGGTGSSGMLDTLLAIHSAANSLGLQPKVRLLVVLPGAFAAQVAEGNMAGQVLQAQRANGYAFFKELDHFLRPTSNLSSALNWEVPIPTGVPVHQVFLLDAKIGGAGNIRQASDVYEIASESLYQFLMTDAGQKLATVEAVNYEQFLSQLDAYGRPRRYCGLGLSRIVFPGDTLRTHLTMFWCNQMLAGGFLRSAEVGALRPEENQKLVVLQSAIVRLAADASNVKGVRSRSELEGRGNRAPADLRESPESADAYALRAEFETSISHMHAESVQVLNEVRPRFLAEGRNRIEETVFADGESVPQAIRLLQAFDRALGRKIQDSESRTEAAKRALETADAKITAALNELQAAEGRSMFEEAAVAVRSMFGSGKRRQDAGEEVGNAIRDWVNAALNAPVSAAEHEYLEAMREHVSRCITELQTAMSRLSTMSTLANAAYVRDELIGKDRGPGATTVLIPGDVEPEIENSLLSRGLVEAIMSEHGHRLVGDPMQEFINGWRFKTGTRGFFDVGSNDTSTARIAEDSLLALLEQDAHLYAVQGRLPTDLVEAANRHGGPGILEQAVRGLEKVSNEVCWSVDLARFSSGPSIPGVETGGKPLVSTVVSRHSTAAAVVEGLTARKVDFADPERIVALSCQWAMPLHCLPVVSEWKYDYDALRLKRLHERANRGPGDPIEPPNHIVRGFETMLDEPVPRYASAESVSEAIVKALTIGAVVRQPDARAAVEMMFVSDANVEPIPPIRFDKTWLLRPCTIDNGRVRPLDVRTDVVLGAEFRKVFAVLGERADLRSSIERLWDTAESHLTLEVLQDALAAEFIADDAWYVKEQKNPDYDPEERATIGLLLNAAKRLHTEIRKSTRR